MGDPDEAALELADIDNRCGWLTGNKLTSPRLCTASDVGTCHIFRELATWNEILCRCSMELKEERPGQLTLAWCQSLTIDPSQRDESHFAETLAFWLLKNHRCVASFDVSEYRSQYPTAGQCGKLITSGLESSTIKKLRISERLDCPAPTLKCLTKLEELYFKFNDGYVPWRGFPESLCSLVATAPSLRTLSLPDTRLEIDDGKLLLNSLGRISTIKELMINMEPFITSPENAASFARYVTKNKALTTLEITGHANNDSGYLKSAISCVSRSESLINVSFCEFAVEEAAASAIEAYLKRNCTVLWFSLKKCLWYNSPTKGCEPYRRIDPWLSILRNSRSLQGLHLTLNAFSIAECDAFFDALTRSCLKQIIIEDLGCHSSRRVQMSRNLSATPLLNAIKSLPGAHGTCAELYRINLSPVEQSGTPSPRGYMPSILLENVTTDLCLYFFASTEDIASLVVEHITKTKAVTELTLGFFFKGPPFDLQDTEFTKTVLRSLLLNSTVKKFSLVALSLSEEAATVLARVMKYSKYVLEYVVCRRDFFESLVERLSPGFAKNYNVISIQSSGIKISHARHWLRVMEIVWRNVSLLAHAVSFVAGSRDRRNAEALELVASSPALLDKVCEELYVEKSEAVRKVQESVDSFQGVDDFMRASGIVMSELRCLPQRDLPVQLTDVDEYSWLAVRKHLRIGDVLCGDKQ